MEASRIRWLVPVLGMMTQTRQIGVPSRELKEYVEKEDPPLDGWIVLRRI